MATKLAYIFVALLIKEATGHKAAQILCKIAGEGPLSSHDFGILFKFRADTWVGPY
jgi:hypothetical protein